MKRAWDQWMSAAVVAISVSVAWAAVVPKDISELTAEANQIVIGDVVSVTSFWDDNHELINSRIVVAVDQYLVGEGTGTEVMVMAGGTVDDTTLYVSVLPIFEEGDHVLLFLGDNEIRLVQSFQGAFLTDGVEVAQMSPPCNRIVADSVRPLGDLLAEIEAALPAGEKLPEIDAYQGDFELPLGGLRYGLCGYDWTYKTDPMGEDYRINPNCKDGSAGDADSQIAQIRYGMSAWTDAGAVFEFTYGGTSTQAYVSNNGTNLVYFHSTPPLPGGGGYVAANFHWVSGGNMLESDIVFNDLDYAWWNGQGTCSNMMDIRNVATHELGHTLCLLDLYGGPDYWKTMYGYVSYCETHKRTLDQDDIDGITAIYGSFDTDPPNPDPMTFSTPPTPYSDHLYMIATTAIDDLSPPVQYEFDFVSGGAGGDDSGWTVQTTYEDIGPMDVNTEYTYQVRARDSASPPNETEYSAPQSAYTQAAVPGAPVLSNETASSMDLDMDANGNPSYTEFAVQCSSTTDASWDGQYVDASGSASASAVWQTEAQWDGTTIVGMQASTEYCFKVKARNGDLIETDLGSETCLTTAAGGAVALAARSYADHAAAGELSLDMGVTGGIEPRTGQVAKIEIDLDDASGVSVSDTATVNCSAAWTGTATVTAVVGNTVTVEFSSSLPNQAYCVITLDCGAQICVRMIEGDMNRSGDTNTTDASSVKARFGATLSDANCEWDFNCSGAINTTDASAVKARFGFTAPDCP